MLSAFTNSLKIPELRQKIFFTLALLFIARVGANIPLPGINTGPITEFMSDQASAGGGVVGLFNMFTGGALLKGAVFALGIMPYISASIIMQLVGAVFPAIARLQQEGDVGRQKINQYTRYLTLGICAVQGLLLLVALSTNPGSLIGQGFNPAEYGSVVIMPQLPFLITGTIFLTAGTMIMVWLGEQITQKGIGNGISLLITVSIISGLPAAVMAAYQMFVAPVGSEGAALGVPEGVLMLGLLFAVTAGLVAITQAQRKIPVQYAKRVVGRKVYGGQSSFLPLKVNYAGVMPVIFASAILMFPAQILSYLGSATGMRFFNDFADAIAHGRAAYYIIFGLLILIFSYFWVSMMFKPIQIADDLKKNGGYIPGVRPGEPTAKFLDHIMTRLTLAGAISITVIALFPDVLLFAYNVPFSVAVFFGGTGMLITVGVLLDTMRQIETYLLQRHYDGFLKKGKIRGRSAARNKQLVDSAGLQDFWTAWRPLLFIAIALFVLGIVSWFLNLG
ncbi:MAG: preprotein translocase subunit SecY [Opitutales bacterium]|jgi:preprotein translocase subunit SecY|nr:preprotein translocase subunit SecY [Opitutales bacterium]MDP4644687.1 preprotein translocase subunit SecY [Opitutales bacterium]MDP4693782.1 preprotein translocase subunit SecY [Opitutales bacterium]MDP4777536.1 preprotein translocase subunit SecY [Opitutales bacterium]MDP4884293.1 preprotein translocase subunit SecY [Opitutales bacterium]